MTYISLWFYTPRFSAGRKTLKRIEGPTIDINTLNGILETYGDTYYIGNSQWELCKEGKKLEE